MNEFKGEELARTNKAAVVLVDEIEREKSKEVGEGEMHGEIGVCVGDEVEPIIRWFLRRGSGRVERPGEISG